MVRQPLFSSPMRPKGPSKYGTIISLPEKHLAWYGNQNSSARRKGPTKYGTKPIVYLCILRACLSGSKSFIPARPSARLFDPKARLASSPKSLSASPLLSLAINLKSQEPARLAAQPKPQPAQASRIHPPARPAFRLESLPGLKPYDTSRMMWFFPVAVELMCGKACGHVIGWLACTSTDRYLLRASHSYL